MLAEEKYYFDKYSLVKEADNNKCGGTGCCSTCMYRKVDQSFENDYCLLSHKEDAKKGWTENYNLTVRRESDGETKNLLADGKFQNFDWLAQQVGGSDSSAYINLNDDLMDGPEANGETFQHTIYKDGEAVDTLTFEYRRKA